VIRVLDETRSQRGPSLCASASMQYPALGTMTITRAHLRGAATLLLASQLSCVGGGTAIRSEGFPTRHSGCQLRDVSRGDKLRLSAVGSSEWIAAETPRCSS
jgi:hypothetical protein